MARLVIAIPDELAAELGKFAGQQGVSPEEAAKDILRRWLAVKRFNELAAITEKYARAAGYTSQEQILAIPRMPREDTP